MNHPQAPSSGFEEGIALVAGGTGGIGAAVVRDLARHGSNVALMYRSKQEAAEQVAADVRALGRTADIARADLTDAAEVKSAVDAFVERHGRLHSVVYAAGPHLTLDFIGAVTPSTWAETMRSTSRVASTWCLRACRI